MNKTNFRPLLLLAAIVAAAGIAWFLFGRTEPGSPTPGGDSGSVGGDRSAQPSKRAEAAPAVPTGTAKGTTMDFTAPDPSETADAAPDAATGTPAGDGVPAETPSRTSVSDIEVVEGEGTDLNAWDPPPVDPEILNDIRNAFADWRESAQDDDATATLRMTLGTRPKSEMLAAAATLMRKGSEQDRMDALWAVASEFAQAPGDEPLVSVNAPDATDAPNATDGPNTLGDPEAMDGPDSTEGSDREAPSPEDEREARETHDLVAIVGAGLEDPSADVRNVALETIAALSPERSGVLYSQLLCSDSETSADVRRKLMDQLEGARDPESVTLFLQAMQSPDAETAAAAKRNLESVAGRSFDSMDAVVNWLETYENDDTPSSSEKDGSR